MKSLNEQLIKIKSIMGINENKQIYPYGCVMLYFNDDDVKKIYPIIDQDDLYTDGEGYGLETEPHCTLLYGLHDNVTDEDIEHVIENHVFDTCKAHNLSCFENDLYDVLKFDIDGNGLFKINDELKQFPYTTEYPNYHPHMTIAYLKPGMGKNYVKLLSKRYDRLYLKPKYVIYSKTDGTKKEMPIHIK